MSAQVSAAQAAGGVTAFSRQREQPRRADLQELAELDAAEAALQSGSDDGDLEDDFLLTATQVPRRCPWLIISLAPDTAIVRGSSQPQHSPLRLRLS